MDLEKAKKVAHFFEKNLKEDALICPACDIEHTGRNAYSIKTFLYLYEHTLEEKYFSLAYHIAKSIMKKLDFSPTQNIKYKVFLPGLHGSHQNNSSNVIDSGAATDMISEFLIFCKEKSIQISEESFWIQELSDHIDLYLLDASLNKSCLNQRLWGLTGVATFYRLTKDEKYKQHVKRSIDKVMLEQNEDGSFDYIINKGDSIEAKFSLFYFPRLLSFILYCMDCIEYYTEIEKLKKSVVLLIDCYDHHYNKILDIENKKWFFTASYEIESLSYDIYFLTQVNNMLGFDISRIVERQVEYYLSHVTSNGVISNNEHKPNLFCEFFDNADFSWFIRSVEKKLLSSSETDNRYEQKPRFYKDANLKIDFVGDKKIIEIINKDLFTSSWGAKNGTLISVDEYSTRVSSPSHIYKFKLHTYWRDNLKNLKNIILLSMYNLRYRKKRLGFLVTMIYRFFKYDLFYNCHKR